MNSRLGDFAHMCWNRVAQKFGDNDPLVWYKDLERHSCGEYSFAVAQANQLLEDHSQVETGSNAIFVGVYDGHGGPDAAQFINRFLFDRLIGIARDHGTVAQQTLRGAVTATEEEFMAHVRNNKLLAPPLVITGSCCLIGVIWKGTLAIANLGDSRAVLGTIDRSDRIIAMQLTEEHNVNRLEIRREVSDAHPFDPNVVFYRNGAWRIKGILQVSRTIGDAYLKKNDCQAGPTLPRFQFSEPILRPILSAEPFLYTRDLQPDDKFLIFASDGLWDHITIQEAAEIVYRSPRRGIARKLVKIAQKVAARKAQTTYKDLLKVDRGQRREVHDDITVVVVFINHQFLGQKITTAQKRSIKGFTNEVGQSNFRVIDDLM